MPVNDLGACTPELKKLVHLMNRHLENLEKLFSEEAKEIFEKYNECVNEYNYAIREQAFHSGFSLGTKLTSEAFAVSE